MKHSEQFVHKIAILLSSFLLVSFVQAASFDCAKAGSKVEKLICNTPSLSKLDSDLADIYKDALRKDSSIRQEQLSWIKERSKCNDVRCLESSYKDRLDDLTNFIVRFDREAMASDQGSKGKQDAESSTPNPKPADVDMFCSGLLFRASGLINSGLSPYKGEALSQLIQLSAHLERSANLLMQRGIVQKGSADSANAGVSVANDVIGRNITGLIQRGSDPHKSVMGCLKRLQ